MSISLIWIGFGAGLSGPAALGREGSWESMDAAVSTAVDSVVYTMELDYIELSTELGDFWPTQGPGPYIASKGNQAFVAVNSSLAPNLHLPGHADFIGGLKGGEVAIGIFSPEIRGEITDFTNISEIDSRIQHVRDLQTHKGLMQVLVTV